MSYSLANIKEFYGIAREEVPILMFRRFKTAYHKRRWVDYEHILMVRSMMSMIARGLLSIAFVVSGTESWHLTEQYFEKDGPANIQLAKKVFPYAKLANQIYLVGRFVFFILCIKWPRLIKMSFYYELLQQFILAFLPLEINVTRDITVTNF